MEDTDQRNPQSPGEILRQMLAERGWKQDDLSIVTGKSLTAISNVITGKSGVTPEMAISLAAAFGNQPEAWLQVDAAYRLSLLNAVDNTDIERRARVFSRAPIREMQRRGWITESADLDVIEHELDLFFGAPVRSLAVAARKGVAVSQPQLTAAETTWCFRAKQMASTLIASPFSESKLPKARTELRRLAAHPKEAKYLSSVLSDFGIRFVVVEPFAGARIDGAAFWDDMGPIIAVSLRHDRVDGFWFTVMHEFSHIAHGDPVSVDTEMIDPVTGVIVKTASSEIEARADAEAGSSLIPSREIDSFIKRVSPFYSRDRIIQFANRIRIHPGIIVGQLQYRKEIGYASLRELLAKIRDNVISTALTDGWGQAISPSVIRSLNR